MIIVFTYFDIMLLYKNTQSDKIHFPPKILHYSTDSGLVYINSFLSNAGRTSELSFCTGFIPPFSFYLQAGLFDPYSDDPRLGVKKVSLCPHTGTLAVAGTAGQVLLMEIATEEKTFVPEVRISLKL